MNGKKLGGIGIPVFVRRIVPALMLISLLLGSSPASLAKGNPTSSSSTRGGGPIAANLLTVPSGESPGARGSLPWAHPGGASLLAQQKAAALGHGATSGVQVPDSSSTTTSALTDPLVGVPAIDSDQSQCYGCYPPDGALAVGPVYVVGAVNTAIAVWDKAGNQVIAPVSLPNFLATDPNCANDFLHGFSDPFVEYDPWANQFIAGMLNFDLFYDSTLCVAATSAGDPTGNWWLYDFPVNLSSTLFDFPQAAVGSDALYVTGNLFQNASTFLGVRAYAIDKASMYAGSPPESPATVYHDVSSQNAAGDPVDTLIPAQGVDVANTMYFTAVDNCDACDTVRLWKWDSPFGSDTFKSQGSVTVQGYGQPPEAAQLGGDPIATNDTRELASSWHDGIISGAHTIACDPGGGTVACTQWYQLGNVDGSPTLLQTGIFGSSGQNRFFPTMAIDKSGNMALGYAYSSASDYAGIRYTGLVNGNTTLEPEQVLVAGQATVSTTGANGRYGDFGTEALDPSDGCTVWHLEEYAQSGQLWGTWLGAFRFSACGASAPDFSLSADPSSQAVAPGGSAAYSVTLNSINGFNGTADLAVSGLPAGAGYSFDPTSVSPGTSSTLTITTDSSTPGGTYTLTITGTSGTLSHETNVELNVQDFAIAANPVSLSFAPGGGGDSTVTLTALGGYSSPVTLSESTPLPTGMNATFNQTTVTPTFGGSTATLSVTTTTSTPAGSYVLTVTGTDSSGLTHGTTVTVNITTAPPDFTISVTPSAQTVSGGGVVSYNVMVASENGYADEVTLSVSGLQRHWTPSWSSNPVTPTAAGTSTALAILTSRAPRGTFTLTITGTGAGGSLVHSQQVTLTVTR